MIGKGSKRVLEREIEEDESILLFAARETYRGITSPIPLVTSVARLPPFSLLPESVMYTSSGMFAMKVLRDYLYDFHKILENAYRLHLNLDSLSGISDAARYSIVAQTLWKNINNPAFYITALVSGNVQSTIDQYYVRQFEEQPLKTWTQWIMNNLGYINDLRITYGLESRTETYARQDIFTSIDRAVETTQEFIDFLRLIIVSIASIFFFYFAIGLYQKSKRRKRSTRRRSLPNVEFELLEFGKRSDKRSGKQSDKRSGKRSRKRRRRRSKK